VIPPLWVWLASLAWVAHALHDGMSVGLGLAALVAAILEW
jgi:hypothetical protein